MSQDSIVIFRSYIDAIAELPAELYKEVSRVLYAYAFDGIEPGEDASPTARALFIALKSQIDFNVARYERAVRNGSKGGAPKGTRNNPNGRRGKRTNQELTETNQELTNPEKLVISEVEGGIETVEAVEVVASEDVQEQPKKAKKGKKGLDKTNQELTENKPTNNQTDEKELTKPKELTLISNQLSINNNYVVVDNAREVSFLEKFFSPQNQYSLDVLCMQSHTTRDVLEQYANEIIAEWKLRGVIHTDYTEASRHLINHLRRKFEADRRRTREDAAAPKSRQQAREDLVKGAAARLAGAIQNEQAGRTPATANDTEPF
ncbi:MAG: hypothetical protein HDS69_02195 [Bacteroidales bacterium]|nr:hypothetical protein [Bacteroidales bacterium]